MLDPVARRSMKYGVLILSAWMAAACGGGDPAARGPQPGSAAWHWEGAVENFEVDDFAKALEHLDDVAASDDPLASKAVLWRTVTLVGLSRGYIEVIDAYRAGIKEDGSREADYQGLIQQANRTGRQYAIELAESLGEVQKAGAGPDVTLDFPFPSGSGARSNMLTAVEAGDAVPAGQLSTAETHTLRRGLIRATAEIGGIEPDNANEASAKFAAGPVTVSATDFRRTMAKLLLDVSLMFSRERVNQPDVRKILIDRAEQWAAPDAESEEDEAQEWSEAFAKEIEDERRDMARKARRVKARS